MLTTMTHLRPSDTKMELLSPRSIHRTDSSESDQDSFHETCVDPLFPTRYVVEVYAELKQPLNSASNEEDAFSDTSETSVVWIPREVQETKHEENESETRSNKSHTCNEQINSANVIRPTTTLSIDHVTYDVKECSGPWWKRACFKEKKRKRLLSDISMQLKSGELTAILGSSGAGKTSLLDVITSRAKGDVSGSVYYNGEVCTDDVIKEHAAYVMQADRLLQNLTIRETLSYSARLRMPGDTSASDIESKVIAVIGEMGLKDVADSLIGSQVVRGISGGEQRRVTIAIHLLKNPDLVLLDEPTSGLDSYTARHLVSNLRDLARRGKIVLLTIHQPSSDIFQFFDQIALMSVGQMVYCGPAKSLVPYFTNLGYPCDRYTNPLDTYVDVASVDRRDKEREGTSLDRVYRLVDVFRSSAMHRATEESLRKLFPLNQAGHHKGMVKRPSCFIVLFTLIRRMNRNVFRDRRDYVSRLLLLPAFMVFILLFLGRLSREQSSIHDRVGLLYQSCAVPTFIGVINSIALFPCLRDVYYRETVDGLYGSAIFLVAYTIHIIPFHIVSSLIFSNILYWSTGLQADPERFGCYSLVVFLLQHHGEMVTVASMGVFLQPTMSTGVISAALSAAILISSGFLKNVQTLVKPMQWLSWALIYRYSGEVLVVNEFSGLDLECPTNLTMTCVRTGDQFLDIYYPGAPDHFARNFGAMVTITIGTLIFTICLYKLVGPKTLH